MSTINYNSIPDEFRMYVQEPLDDSVLDGRDYRLKITAEMEHSRGIAWVGTLMAGDKIVATVENAGHGGANDYIVVNDYLWEAFVEDAYTAYGNRGEAKDSFVQLIDVLTAVTA